MGFLANPHRAFLMQHSDDLEAITDALRSLPAAARGSGALISRELFRSHLRRRLPRHVQLTDSQLDYLFDQFDRDNVSPPGSSWAEGARFGERGLRRSWVPPAGS